MNNNNSNDSLLGYNYFNDFNEFEDEPMSKRLSERRHAVKPYIPEPPKKNIDFVEVKEPNRGILSILLSCCYK